MESLQLPIDCQQHRRIRKSASAIKRKVYIGSIAGGFEFQLGAELICCYGDEHVLKAELG